MDPASVRARLGRAAPRAKTHQPSVLRWSAVAERHEKRQLLIPTFEDHLYRPSSGNHFKMVSLLVVLCDLAFFSLDRIPRFREFPTRIEKKKKLRRNLYTFPPPPPQDSLQCRFDSRLHVCACADGFFFRSVTLLRRFRPLRAPAPGALTCVLASRTPVRPPRPSRA